VFIFVVGLEKIIFVFKLFWYIDIKVKYKNFNILIL
jgi:hypothetical protein